MVQNGDNFNILLLLPLTTPCFFIKRVYKIFVVILEISTKENEYILIARFAER